MKKIREELLERLPLALLSGELQRAATLAVNSSVSVGDDEGENCGDIASALGR